MNSKRFYGAALMSAIVIPSILVGCGDDASNPLCCNEFKAGAAISADIGGSAQSKVAVQAVADFSGIAGAAIEDITTACRGIATDLDVPVADRDAAEAQTGQARMNAYCKLAVSAIGTVKASAGGTLTIVAKPPVCEASISAKANCQASCSGSAKCDVKANPPKCTGGSLEIACKGSCDVTVEKPTIKCEGSCAASCTGSCTVTTGSVKCAGKCNGTCKGQAQGGTGEGIQADGTCKGECTGTCEVVAPEAKCEGSCQGSCNGSCSATGGATAKCDGECKADFEPISCSGGKLEGGCTADVKCDANCDASVSAKAQCTPPSVTVAFAGSANVEAAGRLRATLEANLGVILAFRSRLEGMVAATGSFSANITAVTDIKAACIPPVVAAVGSALSDVKAAATATASVAGSVGSS